MSDVLNMSSMNAADTSVFFKLRVTQFLFFWWKSCNNSFEKNGIGCLNNWLSLLQKKTDYISTCEKQDDCCNKSIVWQHLQLFWWFSHYCVKMNKPQGLFIEKKLDKNPWKSVKLGEPRSSFDNEERVRNWKRTFCYVKSGENTHVGYL